MTKSVALTVLLAVAWTAYGLGVWLPVVEVRPGTGDAVVDAVLNEIGAIKPSAYSILDSVRTLYRERSYFLAALIGGFSVLFPFLKLIMLTVGAARRQPGPKWTKTLAPWSMLDVFVVAVLLICFRGSTTGASIVAREGVYFFAASVIATVPCSFLPEGLRPTR